jgi:hypothetical protein
VPVAAAKADAPDSPATIALTAGSDEPSATQSPPNSRRSNSSLFNIIFYLILSTMANRRLDKDRCQAVKFAECHSASFKITNWSFPYFWETTLDGPPFAVTVAHSKLIKPAELHAIDDVIRLH